MGNATSTSTAQFLVATDGSEGARVRLAAALSSTRGAVVGYVPTASFVVVGTPATAAAAEALSGDVLWVGPLTPADRTARAWDVLLPLLTDVYNDDESNDDNATTTRTTTGEAEVSASASASALLSAAKIVVDGGGRAVVEVLLPPLVSIGAAAGDTADVHVEVPPPASLSRAVARQFASGVAAAAADDGAWARPLAASTDKVLVGVHPRWGWCEPNSARLTHFLKGG